MYRFSCFVNILLRITIQVWLAYRVLRIKAKQSQKQRNLGLDGKAGNRNVINLN